MEQKLAIIALLIVVFSGLSDRLTDDHPSETETVPNQALAVAPAGTADCCIARLPSDPMAPTALQRISTICRSVDGSGRFEEKVCSLLEVKSTSRKNRASFRSSDACKTRC